MHPLFADPICSRHVGSRENPPFRAVRGDLEALTERLLAENAALKQAVADLRAEIAKLKGVTGRPGDPAERHGPEDGAEVDGQGRQARRQAAQTERLVIDEERVIQADVPAGSRFKGYEDFVVQDLVLRPHVVVSAGNAG